MVEATANDDVVALNEEGNVVVVNQPSVKTADESFNTEASSVVSSEDEGTQDNDNDAATTAGPFGNFRRCRAARIARRLARREERQRVVEERKTVQAHERHQVLEDQKRRQDAIPERLLTTTSSSRSVLSFDTSRGSSSTSVSSSRTPLSATPQQQQQQQDQELTTTTTTMGRAGRISVTIVKTEATSYGLGLAQVLPRRKNLVEIEALVTTMAPATPATTDEKETGTATIASSSSLSLLCDSPFRVGDILKTVNNRMVTDHRTVMLQLMNMKNEPVTIVVEPPSPVPAFSSSSTTTTTTTDPQQPQSLNPAVVQAFFRIPPAQEASSWLSDIDFALVEHSTTSKEFCNDPSGEAHEYTTTKLLQIQAIDPDGYFANSVLSEGDFVLTINGISCTNNTNPAATNSSTDTTTDPTTKATPPPPPPDPAILTSHDARTLMLSASVNNTITIVALNPKLAQQHCSPSRAQRWMRTARRASVGAVGGSMLGVGLVMIPFPPPIEELLVIGGASVLASEFEAPKRVMRKARKALQNAVVEDNNNDDDEEERLRRMDSTAAGSLNTDIENKNAVSSTMPNTTNKTRDGVRAVECHYDVNEKTERDTIPSTTNDQKEKVVLRDSFFSVMSQHHGGGSKFDDDDTTDDSAVPVYLQQTTSSTISDCWSEDASSTIDPNINNMYSGKEHEEPSPTKQFLKTVGRKIILPFLDHVVGDDNDTTAPTVVSSPAAPTNVTTGSVDHGSDAGDEEESEDATANAITANTAPATMQAAIDPTAVSFDTENEATADSDPRTDPNVVLDILLS